MAGAWAVLKQAAPSATVDEVLEALTSTGLPVTEPFSGVTKPRIRVFEALATLATIPLMGAITPPRGGQGETLDVTIAGANFQAGATVSFGPEVSVTAVAVPSDREIVATLNIPLTATLGPRTVTVTNPDATSVSRADAFTVTLPPPHVTLVWNGKVRDRVGPTEGQGAPDGQLDGTLTATVTGGARTVTQLALVATGGGRGRLGHDPGQQPLGAGRRPDPDLVAPQHRERLGQLRAGGRRAASRSLAPTGSRGSSCRGRRSR